MKKIVQEYITNLQTTLEGLNQNEFVVVAQKLLEARNRGSNIYIFGNGGSASTASHFACDINKGVSYGKQKRFKVICLNDNLPTLLAYSNDINYDIVFAEQLVNFVKKDDIVIGISGSGNSKNVLNAIDIAKKENAITIGITGFQGGKLKDLCDYSINANVNDMQLSEDVHMIWVHIMMKCLVNEL